ncbi:hypothetical protein ACN4EK_31925 [Pantanalinema rosaneae CENA516]|uniref:hypothetical protein n=1 Tax=Pantanalinema rosaneae TaxID=1620701 RepID=UPI003D6F2A06
MKRKILSFVLLLLLVGCSQSPSLRGKYESETAMAGLEFLSGDEVITNFRNPAYNDFKENYVISKGKQGYLIKIFNVWGSTTQRIDIRENIVILQSDGKTTRYYNVDRFSWE